MWAVGFSAGCSTAHVNELLRVTLQLAARWQGVNSIVTALDVLQAFDRILIKTLVKIMAVKYNTFKFHVTR